MVAPWLSKEEFLWVVARTPLVAIDLIVRDAAGKVLLGVRRNPPAQGTWYVPGGRILKDETLDAAFRRITRAELGVEVERNRATFRGVYEHFHPDNFAGQPGITTHYVVLAYELPPGLIGEAPPRDQHTAYRWWTVPELLAHPQVHPYTKAYFSGDGHGSSS